MEISVEPSKTYAVTTSGSCTVTDADGLELCTASSGSQAFFVATTPTVTVSDDGAKVSRATFNYALAVAGLLGGGDKLPAGYTRLEFLASTGTQYIDTRYIPNNTTGLKGRYCRQESLDSIEVGMREGASSETRFYLPRFGYSVGGGFGWGAWYRGVIINPTTVVQSQLNWLNCRKAEAEGVGTTFKVSMELPTLPFKPTKALFLFAANIAGSASLRCACQMFELRISQGVEQKHIFVPALDPTGTPCMFDLVSRKPFYNSGTGDFTYPGKETQAATYSLRRPRQYAQMTERGIRRLYHVPRGYNGTPEEYAEQNSFKILVDTPQPEEGYWAPVWHEREDCIELEWVETEPPAEELSNVE